MKNKFSTSLFRNSANTILRVFGLHTRFPWPQVASGQRAINLGAGWQRQEGYDSHDLVDHHGFNLDHSFDLEDRPWPLLENQFDVIVLNNVLEHCRDVNAVMEEIYRIAKANAQVVIRVPYWHSNTAFVDPTHLSFFSFDTFDYFDPSTRHGQIRRYYSKAKFRLEDRWLNCLGLPISSSNVVLNFFLRLLAQRVGGIVHGMTFFLTALKQAQDNVNNKEIDTNERCKQQVI